MKMSSNGVSGVRAAKAGASKGSARRIRVAASLALLGAASLPMVGWAAYTDAAADKHLDLFLKALQGPVAKGKVGTQALAGKNAPKLTQEQFERALSVLAPMRIGHGTSSGASTNSSDPSPSIYGFCYETCRTNNAVASCGVPAPGEKLPPLQNCKPVIDSQLLESIIGPQVGTGQSPFVDDNTGPDGVQPAGYTFIGQLLDHDITRTQTDLSSLEEMNAKVQGDPALAAKLAAAGVTPAMIKKALVDATVPTSKLSVNTGKIDLDTVYGVTDFATLQTLNLGWYEQKDGQYTGRFALTHLEAPTSTDSPLQIDGFDLQRADSGSAVIADPRDSENRLIAGVEVILALSHNDCMDKTLAGVASPTPTQIGDAFDSCHQKVIWTWETIVATDFLPRISADASIARTSSGKLHGYVRGTEPTSVLPAASDVHPYLYSCKTGLGANAVIHIPQEFAVAGFRLGHTLVRDDYQLHSPVYGDDGALLTGSDRPIFAAFGEPTSDGLGGATPMLTKDVVDWSYLFDFGGKTATPSRPFDSLVSDKLFSLPQATLPPGNGADGVDTSNERNLPRRNVLRAAHKSFKLNNSVGLGTGEELAAYALARIPGLEDPSAQVDAVLGKHLTAAGFAADAFAGRTPMWLYIIGEGEATAASEHLGEIGSHVVDDFILGSLKCDGASVLNVPSSSLTGWGPVEAIAKNHRYSMPELISYLTNNASANGAPYRLTSR